MCCCWQSGKLVGVSAGTLARLYLSGNQLCGIADFRETEMSC